MHIVHYPNNFVSLVSPTVIIESRNYYPEYNHECIANTYFRLGCYLITDSSLDTTLFTVCSPSIVT